MRPLNPLRSAETRYPSPSGFTVAKGGAPAGGEGKNLSIRVCTVFAPSPVAGLSPANAGQAASAAPATRQTCAAGRRNRVTDIVGPSRFKNKARATLAQKGLRRALLSVDQSDGFSAPGARARRHSEPALSRPLPSPPPAPSRRRAPRSAGRVRAKPRTRPTAPRA